MAVELQQVGHLVQRDVPLQIEGHGAVDVLGNAAVAESVLGGVEPYIAQSIEQNARSPH